MIHTGVGYSDACALHSFNAQSSNKAAILNLIEDLHRAMGLRLPASPKLDAACGRSRREDEYLRILTMHLFHPVEG